MKKTTTMTTRRGQKSHRFQLDPLIYSDLPHLSLEYQTQMQGRCSKQTNWMKSASSWRCSAASGGPKPPDGCLFWPGTSTSGGSSFLTRRRQTCEAWFQRQNYRLCLVQQSPSRRRLLWIWAIQIKLNWIPKFEAAVFYLFVTSFF